MGVCRAQEIDFIEHFAGSATLTHEARASGFRAAALDKIYGQGLDILEPSGFGFLVMSNGDLFLVVLS